MLGRRATGTGTLPEWPDCDMTDTWRLDLPRWSSKSIEIRKRVGTVQGGVGEGNDLMANPIKRTSDGAQTLDGHRWAWMPVVTVMRLLAGPRYVSSSSSIMGWKGADIGHLSRSSTLPTKSFFSLPVLYPRVSLCIKKHTHNGSGRNIYPIDVPIIPCAIRPHCRWKCFFFFLFSGGSDCSSLPIAKRLTFCTPSLYASQFSCFYSCLMFVET